MSAFGLVVIGATRFQAARRNTRGATAAVHISLAAAGALVCAGAGEGWPGGRDGGPGRREGVHPP